MAQKGAETKIAKKPKVKVRLPEEGKVGENIEKKDGFGKHAKVVINNNEAREGENPATKIDEKEENHEVLIKENNNPRTAKDKKGKNLEMPSDATDDPETTNDEESLEAMSDSEWESGWV